MFELALAGDDVGQIETGEFVLMRQRLFEKAMFCQTLQHPVVERALVFKFERADRVADVFQCIFDRVRVAIHRIDTPFITGIVVGGVANTIDGRIAQIHVGAGHVDACTQNQAAIGMFAIAHFFKQAQRFFGRTIAPWRIDTSFGQRATIGAHLFSVLFIDIGVAGTDQCLCTGVHDVEVVASVVQVGLTVCIPVKA